MSENQPIAATELAPTWRDRRREFHPYLTAFVAKDFSRVGLPVLTLLEAFFFYRGVNLFREMVYYAPSMALYTLLVASIFRNSAPFYEEAIKEFIVITVYSFCTIFGLCIALYEMGKIDAAGIPHGWLAKHLMDFVQEDANLFRNIKISACIFLAVLSAQVICTISFKLLGFNETRDHRIRTYLWFGLYWERDPVPDEINDVLTAQDMAEVCAPIIERSQFGIDASKFFSTLIFKCFCAAVASMSAFLLFIEIIFPNHLPEEHSSRIFVFIFICIISVFFVAFYYVETITRKIINHIMNLF